MKNKNRFLIFAVIMLVIAVNLIINLSNNDYTISLNTLMLKAYAETETAKTICEAAEGEYNYDEFTIPIPWDDDIIICKWDPSDCCVTNDLR